MAAMLSLLVRVAERIESGDPVTRPDSGSLAAKLRYVMAPENARPRRSEPW